MEIRIGKFLRDKLWFKIFSKILTKNIYKYLPLVAASLCGGGRVCEHLAVQPDVPVDVGVVHCPPLIEILGEDAALRDLVPSDLAPGTNDIVPSARSLRRRRARALAAAAAAASGSISAPAASTRGLVCASLLLQARLSESQPLLLLGLVKSLDQQPAEIGIVGFTDFFTPLD